MNDPIRDIALVIIAGMLGALVIATSTHLYNIANAIDRNTAACGDTT